MLLERALLFLAIAIAFRLGSRGGRGRWRWAGRGPRSSETATRAVAEPESYDYCMIGSPSCEAGAEGRRGNGGIVACSLQSLPRL
jgi:hypothetical protein